METAGHMRTQSWRNATSSALMLLPLSSGSQGSRETIRQLHCRRCRSPSFRLPVTTPALFTFGYEGLTIYGGITRLKDARANMMLDVREPQITRNGVLKNSLRDQMTLEMY